MKDRKNIYDVKEEAAKEANEYFDKYFGANTDPLAHNDARDAFRHAYVSGVFSMERGETVAKALGWINEIKGYLHKKRIRICGTTPRVESMPTMPRRKKIWPIELQKA